MLRRDLLKTLPAAVAASLSIREAADVVIDPSSPLGLAEAAAAVREWARDPLADACRQYAPYAALAGPTYIPDDPRYVTVVDRFHNRVNTVLAVLWGVDMSHRGVPIRITSPWWSDSRVHVQHPRAYAGPEVFDVRSDDAAAILLGLYDDLRDQVPVGTVAATAPRVRIDATGDLILLVEVGVAFDRAV